MLNSDLSTKVAVLPKLSSVAGKKVYVGVSGGVDSALSAAILKNSGADVYGVFMKNWAGEAGLQLDCPWEEDMKMAQEVCQYLGIPFRSYNFEEEYKEMVLDNFFSEYQAGRTPNPDILCNSEIKFKAFLNRAEKEGADFISTGHYARLQEVDSQLFGKARLLIKHADKNKDQTYFLSGLSQDQLARAIFPLANLTKPEVRELAKKIELPNANRSDSQGICFIGDLDVQAFLRKYLAKNPGSIIDVDTNKVVGQHEGLSFYTIGQREGLQIGGVPLPYYVAGKDRDKNYLFIAQGKDNLALFSAELNFTDLHWCTDNLIKVGLADLNAEKLEATIRYRANSQPGQFIALDLGAKTGTYRFAEKVRAVAPGQSVVFFLHDLCLGKGIIS